MKKSWTGIGVAACLPFAAIAQPQVADPATPVPAVVYRSVFADTSQGVETGTVPWRAANAEVGQFTRGHMDILKWEAARAKPDPARPAMPMPRGTTMEPKKP